MLLVACIWIDIHQITRSDFWTNNISTWVTHEKLKYIMLSNFAGLPGADSGTAFKNLFTSVQRVQELVKQKASFFSVCTYYYEVKADCTM